MISLRRLQKLNEDLSKLLLQERDRTFDDYDYDDLEQIVDSTYGSSYYILTKGKQYRAYETVDNSIYELGSFRSRKKAIDRICREFDGDDITDVYDHGDIQFYDSDVEKYALEHAYFGEEDDEDADDEPKKTYETFADWFGKDLTGQTYEGDIDCSERGLISLKGAPQKISGNFNCEDNQLTSLEGAPQKISGNFNCQYNQLTSLEGAPQVVSGKFNCRRNQLTSLEGAPQEVGGNFICENNQLTSLEGAPKKVGGNFICDDYLEDEARKMGYNV